MRDEKIFEYSTFLANMIKESDAYINYLIYKNKIEENSIINEKIKKFKNEQMSLELRRIQGEEVPFEYENYINSLYSDILASENGFEFLNFEKLLFKLISDVYEKISAEIGIDFSYYD